MAHVDCRRWLADLSDYVDEEAAASVCEEIERHLRECGDCRIVIETLRQTLRLYQDVPQPALPPEAWDRLFRGLDLADYSPSAPARRKVQDSRSAG